MRFFSWTWKHRSRYSAFALVSAICFGLASMFFETSFAPVLVLVSALLLVVIAKRSRYLSEDFFLWGFIFHGFAFYWLPDTLSFFGGFPKPVAYLLFFLYAALSSVQLLLVALLCSRFRVPWSVLETFKLPLAWFLLEFLFPRLFPWCFAHPLIGLRSIALLASVMSVPILSFLLFWSAEMLIVFLTGNARKQKPALIAFFLVLGLASALSRHRAHELDEQMSARALKLGIIQGNLAATQKGDIRFLSANLQRYRELSREAVEQGAELIIWPESVMNVWTPEDTVSVVGTKFDPFPELQVPLLYGGLSFRRKPEAEIEALPTDLDPREAEQLKYRKFNTAFLRSAEGTLLGYYHKKVLMPFGEYLPLSERFPIIRTISPQSGDFSSGDRLETIRVPHQGDAYQLGTLICYEDLLPKLALAFEKKGANLLVNLTNDAWYGETAAPYQHHLLASWRAIETGRYLVRSTNTGFTGVVDPSGKTIARAGLFEEKVILENVRLLSGTTFHARFGDVPALVLAFMALLFLPARILERKSVE